MKKNMPLAVSLLIAVTSPVSYSNTLAAPIEQEIKSNGFLIKWKKSAKFDRLNTLAKVKGDIQISRSLNVKNQQIDLVSVPSNISDKDARILLTNMPDVEFVEPNYLYSTQANVNDPEFNALWGLHNENDTDINVMQAWDVTIGSEDVVIAVIDSGVDYTHPDLNANMWQNPNEIPDNNIDDDGNGYVDDIYGIDTVNNDSDPMDDNKHGTHVAGTIAAVGNNEIGIVGVAQKAKIISCKFLSGVGSGDTAGAIECLNYLADLKENHNVNLIATNNSWGGGGRSELLESAIQRHQDLGITFVAAAGNDAHNTDISPAYPASYDNENIISVASITSTGALSSFSNWGETSVDIAAPGSDIYSTVPGGQYQNLSGTSMAAPHVTGAIALLAADKPELTMVEQINLVQTAYRDNEALLGKIKTGGQLLTYGDNSDGMLNCENKITTRLISPVINTETLRVSVGDEVLISVSSQNCSHPYSDFDKTVNIQSIGNQILLDDGTGADNIAGDGVFSTSFVVETDSTLQVNFTDETISDFTVQGFDIPKIVPEGYIYNSIEGTDLNLSDDDTRTIELPFELTGSLGVFSHITISSNGLIFFGENGHNSYGNTTLPSTGSEHEFVAPYWRDLIALDDAGYFYQVIGAAPNRKMVVEYRNVSHYGNRVNETNTVTFQVVFDEADGDVIVNYKDIDIDGSGAGGLTATTGYQVQSDARQNSYNEKTLLSESAWRITLSGNDNPDNLRFTQLSVDGAFRPGFPLDFNVLATSNNTEIAMVIEIDRGFGSNWEPISTEQFSEMIENSGIYNYVFRVTQGEYSRLANLDFNVLPLTTNESLLIGLSEQRQIDLIVENPSQYELISLADHQSIVSETEQSAQNEMLATIQNTPSEYGLITTDDSDKLIEGAINVAKASMTEQIQASPQEFGLIDITDSNKLIEDAINVAKASMTEQIQASPQEFGLIDITDSNKLIEDAINVAKASMTEQIQASPQEFGLIDITDSNKLIEDAINVAKASMTEQIQASPQEFGLIGITDSNRLIDNAINIAKASMTEQIQGSPQEFGLIDITDSNKLIADAINVTKTSMTEQIQASPQEFNLYPLEELSLINQDTIASLPEGSHLMGSSVDISDLAAVFGESKSVWVHKEGVFYAWSANSETMAKIINTGFKPLTSITAGQGFWVKK